ncbi:hypothetical protein BDN72DRAFT_838357, partial [Pluteus cervinus]
FAEVYPYIVNVSLVHVLPDSCLLFASRRRVYKPHRAHPASFSTLSLSPASGFHSSESDSQQPAPILVSSTSSNHL